MNRILVYTVVSGLFFSPIVSAYGREFACLRPKLLLARDKTPLQDTTAGAIAKLESIRIVEIKNIGDDRVELHAIIKWIRKTTEFPIVLYAKRAPNMISEQDINKVKTGHEKIDEALLETYKEIPAENYFILEENFYRIRGFGQFEQDGIRTVGLVESLKDDHIPKLMRVSETLL